MWVYTAVTTPTYSRVLNSYKYRCIVTNKGIGGNYYFEICKVEKGNLGGICLFIE